MNQLKFEDMRHEVTENGIESISEVFGGLQFTPIDELCVGLMHTGTKPLTFHFAIFKPDFSLSRFLQFDVRELTQTPSISLSLKGEEKLADIVDLLENSFSSEHELLAAIIETKSKPMCIS